MARYWFDKTPPCAAGFISLSYIAVGVAWIVGSDLLLHDDGTLLLENIAKGLLFVFCTGALLFALLLRSYRRIDEAQALQSLRFAQTITTLARMIEYRDIYTHGHQQRVAQLCDALAARMNLPRARRTALVLAAELHDIGKIGVPEHLLNKAGYLTDAERDKIREHAAIGAELLSNIDFPGPVADIVAQHHERMDGTGYPAGLAGEEILPEARILAVADVFEAMSSARPYRNAQGREVALVELRRGAGAKYDPRVVAECEAWSAARDAHPPLYSAAGKQKSSVSSSTAP